MYLRVKNITPILLDEEPYVDKFNLLFCYLPMNPSLYIDKDGNTKILVRYINYSKYKNIYMEHENRSISKYKILTGRIDGNELLNLNEFEVNNIEYTYNIPTYNSYWLGLEDIRFIHSHDLIITIPECNKEGNPSIFYGQLLDNTIHSFEECYPNIQEKNWMPYLDKNDLCYVVYSVYPFKIKEPIKDTFLDINIENDLLKDYHGSTNGVEYKNTNQRLFLVHVNKDNKVFHRWLLLNIENYTICLSQEFLFFKHTYIEFPINISLFNERIFISMGVNDSQAYIIETTQDYVDELF